MSPAPLPYETCLVLEPNQRISRHSEGALIEFSDGALALVYSRFYGGQSDQSAAVIAWMLSQDRGQTWTDQGVLVSNEGLMNVMSVSLLRLSSDELLFFYEIKHSLGDCRLYVRRTCDYFASMSEPVCVTSPKGYYVVNNDRVIQLHSGRLLVPAALHDCPDGTYKTFDWRGRSLYFYSDDQGKSWTPGDTKLELSPSDKNGLQEPGLIELISGDLLMWMRTGRGRQYFSRSQNQGANWSRPRPSKLQSPLSPASIKRIPWNHALLAVFNDHSGHHPFCEDQRTPLCLAVSLDEAKTWRPSVKLEDNPWGIYCYASITFSGDELFLGYCAGDKITGGLNRLKVIKIAKSDLESSL